MKHSQILVLLGGVLLGSTVTAAVLVPLLSASKPAGVITATPASQPENRISETRNVLRGGLQGTQPAPAEDPKPSDQKTAKPVTATSSRTDVSAPPGNSAQPALASPVPSSRPPVSSALPVAQTSHVASLPAPRQVSGAQPAASSSSSGGVPASSMSSASAPMPGSFSSGTAGSDALTIGPTDVVPAALAPPNPAAKLTPQQQALADQMGQKFLQAATTPAGSAAPGSPAAATAQTGNAAASGNAVNQQTWSQNQKLSDAMYKLYFGYQAYNVQSANAYRASLQSSGK